MKTRIYTIGVLLAVSLASCSDDEQLSIDNLPEQAAPQVLEEYAPTGYVEQDFTLDNFGPQIDYYEQPYIIERETIREVDNGGSGVGSFVAGAVGGAVLSNMLTGDNRRTTRKPVTQTIAITPAVKKAPVKKPIAKVQVVKKPAVIKAKPKKKVSKVRRAPKKVRVYKKRRSTKRRR